MEVDSYSVQLCSNTCINKCWKRLIYHRSATTRHYQHAGKYEIIPLRSGTGIFPLVAQIQELITTQISTWKGKYLNRQTFTVALRYPCRKHLRLTFGGDLEGFNRKKRLLTELESISGRSQISFPSCEKQSNGVKTHKNGKNEAEGWTNISISWTSEPGYYDVTVNIMVSGVGEGKRTWKQQGYPHITKNSRNTNFPAHAAHVQIRCALWLLTKTSKWNLTCKGATTQ